MSENKFIKLFQGRDVSLGHEIVEGLQAENIGVSVYELHYGKDEGDQVRRSLLGLVLPTGEPNEYVFLGTEEHGAVIKVTNGSSLNNDFNSDISQNQFLGGKFWEKMHEVHNREFSIKIREDKNLKGFSQVVTKAVTRARQERATKKDHLAESRDNLKSSLF